jgi:hypothetical protein
VSELPRQGAGQPWLTSMSYQADVELLRNDGVDDPALQLTNSADVRSRELVLA